MTSENQISDLSHDLPVAVVTGGSSGLGAALVTALDLAGYRVVTDARDGHALAHAARRWSANVLTVAGDVTDPHHRAALMDAVRGDGPAPARLDLLVNNASTLGASPLRPLAETPPEAWSATWTTNVVAPVELTRAALPALRRAGGIVVSISSDAAAEHYPTWGAYGASKAALDHYSGTLGVEEAGRVQVYAFDPGDMRTPMHQAAFPGEDISDRPEPESVVPALMALLHRRPDSGRYRAADLAGLADAATDRSRVQA